jgi:hypothetical protein
VRPGRSSGDGRHGRRKRSSAKTRVMRLLITPPSLERPASVVGIYDGLRSTSIENGTFHEQGQRRREAV